MYKKITITLIVLNLLTMALSTAVIKGRDRTIEAMKANHKEQIKELDNEADGWSRMYIDLEKDYTKLKVVTEEQKDFIQKVMDKNLELFNENERLDRENRRLKW